MVEMKSFGQQYFMEEFIFDFDSVLHKQEPFPVLSVHVFRNVVFSKMFPFLIFQCVLWNYVVFSKMLICFLKCFVFRNVHLRATTETANYDRLSGSIFSRHKHQQVFYSRVFIYHLWQTLQTSHNQTMRFKCLSGTVVTGNEVMRASLGVHSMESDSLTRVNPDRSTEL